MTKILKFIKPYRIAAYIALILMLIELSVELLQPLLIGKIIDEGILNNDMSVVLYWGGIMLVLSLIAFFSGITNSYYAAYVGQNLGFSIRKKLMKKVQSFSFTNFNTFPHASLITRMTNDVTQVQNIVFMGLRIMLRAPLLIIGSLILAVLVNWQLALIFLITIPIVVVFLVVVMTKGGKMFRSVQQKLDTVNNVMQESLIGLRLIKAYNRRTHEVEKFTNVSNNLREQTASALRLMEAAMPALLFIMNVCIIFILWIGREQLQATNIEVGEVVSIINYATRMTTAFSMFSFIIMAFSRARASSERIVEVLEAKIDLEDEEDGKSLEQLKGAVTFEHVSFRYPGMSSYVLKDISFHVRPGETVAILGSTGAGKSSILQLIPRLYDPTEGAVYVDGMNLKDIKMDDLRKRIGFTPQESILFSGTVEENLAWGKSDASLSEMKAAAKDAQIHETITDLKDGYETKLGQKGINLSGGQKQRLSVARALIRKPNILILDDSTSALDLQTESKVLDAIDEYKCTLFIVTQKLSTAKRADKIMLIDDGKIIEEGTHDQLMNTSALYREIAYSQSEQGAMDRVY